MVYLSLKSLHILAVILWVGSLFLVTLVTSINKLNKEQVRSAMRVTDISIGVTWFAGIVLVIMGGWYTASWWHIKVVLVIAISAIHTFVHRRWANSGSEGASTSAIVPYLVLLLALLAVLLVVFKQPV